VTENSNPSDVQEEVQGEPKQGSFFPVEQDRKDAANATEHASGSKNRPRIGKKRTLGDKWRLTSLPNKIISIATVVIAFASALAFGTAVLQWLEMHDAGAQTNKIIAADERLANAMESSVKQAGKSIDATLKQFHSEQRAWLSIELGTMHWAENEPIQVPMTLTNTGKTPAKRMTGHALVEKLLLGQVPHFGQASIYMRTGIIVPNAPISSWGFKSGKPIAEQRVTDKQELLIMSKTDLADVVAGRAFAVAHGEIDYSDVFGVPHWTRFCIYNAASTALTSFTMQKAVTSCTKYNDTDEN